MKKRSLILFTVILAMLCFTTISAFAEAANEGIIENFQKSNTYAKNQFVDVEKSAWYANDVEFAYEYGLFNGVSENSFNPAGNLSIAQTVVVASRLHKIYTTGEATFETSSPWYQSYVDYAIANDIIGKGEFNDFNRLTTRTEFANILFNSLPSSVFKEKNTVEDNIIPDVSLDDDGAEAIYALYRAGVLTGNDEKGTYTPDANIQRSGATAIVSRVVNANNRKSIILIGESPEFSPQWPLDTGTASNMFITALERYSTGQEHPTAWYANSGIPIDIASYYGAPVYAVESGKVTVADYKNSTDNSQNKSVVIEHGNGLSSKYGHLSSITVNIGDTVTKGQQIGAVGSSGNSATHLHLNLFKYNSGTSNSIDIYREYYRDTYAGQFTYHQWVYDLLNIPAYCNLYPEISEPCSGAEIQTQSAKDITENNAVLQGYVEGSVSNSGFFYSEVEREVESKTANSISFNIATSYAHTVTCDMNKEAGITLTPGTTYYYMAFVDGMDGDRLYGQVMSFTTEAPSLPPASIETNNAKDVTKTNAVLVGYVEGNALNSGFYFGTSEATVINKTSDEISFNVATDYSHTVTCDMNDEAKVTLTPGTTYYYMAFTDGADGNRYYGELKSFTTESEPISPEFSPQWPLDTGTASNMFITALERYSTGQEHPTAWYANSGIPIDIASYYGAPVYAVESGKVTVADYKNSTDNSQNKSVVIEHGNGLSSKYGHLSSITVNIGDTVTKGQQIGAVGSSGNSATHLHLNLFKYNSGTSNSIDIYREYYRDTYAGQFTYHQWVYDLLNIPAYCNLYPEISDGCSDTGGDNKEPLASIQTNSATNVTKTNAVLVGYLQGTAVNSGFYYGTSKNEVENETSSKIGFNVPTNYAHSVTCNMNTEAGVTLTPGTTYYYRAFTETSDGERYLGEVFSFTTLEEEKIYAEIQTNEATGITRTNAVLVGYLQGTAVNSGFYYGTSKSDVENLTSYKKGFNYPTNYAHSVTCNMNTEAKVTLTPGTTYYYRAFTETSDGHRYLGDVKSFTTLD